MGKVPIEIENNTDLIVTSMLTREISETDLGNLDIIGIEDQAEKQLKIEQVEAARQHFLKTVKRLQDGRYEVLEIVDTPMNNCVNIKNTVSYSSDINSCTDDRILNTDRLNEKSVIVLKNGLSTHSSVLSENIKENLDKQEKVQLTDSIVNFENATNIVSNAGLVLNEGGYLYPENCLDNIQTLETNIELIKTVSVLDEGNKCNSETDRCNLISKVSVSNENRSLEKHRPLSQDVDNLQCSSDYSSDAVNNSNKVNLDVCNAIEDLITTTINESCSELNGVQKMDICLPSKTESLNFVSDSSHTLPEKSDPKVLIVKGIKYPHGKSCTAVLDKDSEIEIKHKFDSEKKLMVPENITNVPVVSNNDENNSLLCHSTQNIKNAHQVSVLFDSNQNEAAYPKSKKKWKGWLKPSCIPIAIILVLIILVVLLPLIGQDEVVKDSSVNRIEWKFIPPAPPWWGGFWERLIGLMKNVLRKVLGTASLKYEELVTLLCDCENILNCRPLTYMSEDLEMEPITPALFFRDLKESRVPDLDCIDAKYLQRRYAYRMKVREDLRKRFRTEYLGQLRNHASKVRKYRELTIGDIVLIETNEKRVYWPLGKIIQLIPGKDGVLRLVKLRTRLGEVLRPLQRLYPLEVNLQSDIPFRDCVGNNKDFADKVCDNVVAPPKVEETVPVVNSRSANRPVLDPPRVTKCGRVVRAPDRLDLLNCSTTVVEFQYGETQGGENVAALLLCEPICRWARRDASGGPDVV